MSSGVFALVLANVLMLVVGCGLLPLMGLARTRWELVVRLPLAYAVGLAATAVLAAVLAVVGVAVGRVGLSVLAGVSLVVGMVGLPGGERPRLRRLAGGEVGSLLVLGAAAVYAIPALRLAVVKPLSVFEGWEVWATRARALYVFGHPVAPVFTDPLYGGLSDGLLLPALEALDFRFIGGFDGRLLHLQLLGFGLALVGGGWILLRRWTNPLLLAASLLAIVTAPGFLGELLSGSPELPLAVFVALGVAALAAWLRSGGERGYLAAATLFLAAAALTAEAGLWLALAGLAAAALVARPAARRALAIAAALVAVCWLHWIAWLRVHDVHPHGASIWHLFSPAYLSRHVDRWQPAAAEVWHESWQVQRWGYLVPLLVLGLLGALVQRRWRLAVFGVVWLLLSFVGLVAIHVLPEGQSTPDLASASLVLASLLLVPLLAYAGPEPAPVPAESRNRPHLLLRVLAAPVSRVSPIVFPRGESPSRGGGLPWARPRLERVLLVLVAAAVLTPVYSVNAQDVSRLCLTRALVQAEVSNDSCLGSYLGIDRASHGGHLYSDKAPGMSVLEIPAAVAVAIPDPQRWWLEDLGVWATRVLSSGIAFVLGAFLVGRITEGLAPGYGGLSLVTFAVGTLVAPFGAANFGNVTAGTLGLGALALAWSRRPFLAGLTVGFAVDVEYQSFLIVLILAAYVAFQSRRSLAAYALGVLPGMTLLALYNWIAFDAPWRMSYRYVTEEFAERQAAGFFGIHLPYAHAIRDVFVGNGGLLLTSPIVVAAALGLFLLSKRFPAEALVCAAVVLAFVALNCGYFDPYGGHSPGPRFLVPALPFLALGLGPAFARHFWPTATLALLSIVPTVAATLTWPNGTGRPSSSIWGELDHFRSSWVVHRLSSNVLHWLGTGRQTAAILVAATAASAFLLALQHAWIQRRTAPQTDP